MDRADDEHDARSRSEAGSSGAARPATAPVDDERDTDHDLGEAAAAFATGRREAGDERDTARDVPRHDEPSSAKTGTASDVATVLDLLSGVPLPDPDAAKATDLDLVPLDGPWTRPVAAPEPDDEARPEPGTGTAPAARLNATATANRRTTDVDAAPAAGSLIIEAGEARFDTHPDPPRVSTRKVDYGPDSDAEWDANADAESSVELDPTGPGDGRAETVIAQALPKTTRRERPARPGAGGTEISDGPPAAFFTQRERRVLAGAAIVGAAVMILSYLVGVAV